MTPQPLQRVSQGLSCFQSQRPPHWPRTSRSVCGRLRLSLQAGLPFLSGWAWLRHGRCPGWKREEGTNAALMAQSGASPAAPVPGLFSVPAYPPRPLPIHPATHLPLQPSILHPYTSPSIHLPIHPSTYSSIHPSTHLPIHPSIHPPPHPSIHPPTHPSIHPPTHPPSTHLLNHPSIHLFIHPPTNYPPTHPSVLPPFSLLSSRFSLGESRPRAASGCQCSPKPRGAW